MDASFWAGVPPRPPSIAEWEDLLVRLDIAPRAVRVAVDDARGEGPGVLRVLQVALARESWFTEVIAALREGRPVSLGVAFAPVAAGGDPERAEEGARELCWAFESARSRNFAQVQRRGLGVWDWESPLEEGGTLSTFQALSGLARADGETLAMVRAAGRGEATA